MFAIQSVELPMPAYTALREYLKQQVRLAQLPSVLSETVELGLEQQQETRGRMAIG